MKNLELHFFIGKCLSLNDGGEKRTFIINTIAKGEIDWDKFVWICSNNLVIQTVFVKFRKYGILEYLPSELASYLSEIYNLNLERNQRILEQISEISRLFSHSNIQPVYLKGSANLVNGLYEDIGRRLMADIDILVLEKDFYASAEILESQGYKSSKPLYEDYSQLMHYPELKREDVPAVVEIHRIPVARPWSKKLTAETVFDNIVQIPGKENYYVPSIEHSLCINFIHSQLSNKGSITGLVSFRDMYDAYLLKLKAGNEIDFHNFPFKNRAKSYFHLVSKVLDTEKDFEEKESFGNKLYLLHYKLNISSKVYYNSFRVLRGIIEIVFINYLFTFFKIWFDKELRKSVLLKIRSRAWYIGHFRSLRERFK